MTTNHNSSERRLSMLEKAYLADRERWKSNEERWKSNEERWKKSDQRIMAILRLLQDQQSRLAKHDEALGQLNRLVRRLLER